jgi:hypothetical protein
MAFRTYRAAAGYNANSSVGVVPSRQGPQGSFFPVAPVLFGPIAGRINVLRPLTVTIEQDEAGLFIASDSVFHMHGTGNSLGDALGDYVAVLREYYEHLNAANDDEPTARLFDYLRAYVRPLP